MFVIAEDSGEDERRAMLPVCLRCLFHLHKIEEVFFLSLAFIKFSFTSMLTEKKTFSRSPSDITKTKKLESIFCTSKLLSLK